MIMYVLVEDKELRFVVFFSSYICHLYLQGSLLLSCSGCLAQIEGKAFLRKKKQKNTIIFIRGIPPSFSGLLDEEESLCIPLIIQNCALLEEPDYCGIAVTKANKLF